MRVAVGLLLALLTIVSGRATAPTAVGVNVTLSLQVLPTATGVAQVPRVTLNGAVVVAAVTTSGAVPVFVTSAVLVVEVPVRFTPNAMPAMVAVVGAFTPVPLNETLEGEPKAL